MHTIWKQKLDSGFVELLDIPEKQVQNSLDVGAV